MQLISPEDIRKLLEQPRENSVSIYMSILPVGPEVRQNPIRFKNLVKEAQKRLVEAGLEEKDAIALLEKSHQLDEPSFWEGLGDRSLAVFVSEDIFRYYTLPIDVPELVVVTDRFHIKPLLTMLNGDGRFYMLALSQKQVRMLECTRYKFQEIDLSAFEDIPTSMAEALKYDDESEKRLQRHSNVGGRVANTSAGSVHGQGAGTSGGEEHKVNIGRFFQDLDRGLQQILHAEQAPLVLAGVDYLLPLYRDVNSYQHLMSEGIVGNPEIVSAQELHQQALSIVEAYFQQEQQQVLERYHELFANNTGKATNNLTKIVPAAYYQRIDSLLVAVGEQQWGLFDPGSETVYVHEQAEPGDEDLLDFAAAHTLLNGGHVYAVSLEKVPYSAPIAAIFRY